MLGFGCILFALGSAACALAPSTAWLIAARVVQGIAAAVLTPASLALIGSTFPLDERNRAIGVWAAASSLTTAGGPVLGGRLTEAFGWPSIFWINPPLAIIVVGILARFAPEDRRVPQRFDVFGAAILAAALGALAWSLSQIGPAEPDAAASSVSNGTIAVVAGLGCAGLGGYVMWERTSRHPMTPPRLAENQAFLGLNIATLLLYTGLSIVLFQLPFDLIDRRGLPSTIAGMAFLPFTLGVGLLSRFFGGIADSTGPRALLIAGPIGAAAAYVWMGIAHQSGLIIGVIGPMALLGISFAVLVAPLTASVMSSVEREDEGLASGVNNAASRVAQLVGISLAAGVASFASGYQVSLMIAAAVSLSGALVVAMMSRPTAMKSSRSRQG
jgi:MFS family permease